jgi:glycosyltransferase involved in cell wall biosynthesis
MIKKTKYFEIQSSHVIDEFENFINIKKKSFFVKNDFLATRDSFKKPKYYDLNEEITFLYIVGPHFEMLHKNITDFFQAMLLLLENDINFKIKITLTYDQLNKSILWDKRLNKSTTFLGYIDDNESMLNIYKDNAVLISTSVIETLGLHVIEATQNGILCIVPKERYSDKVYGNTDLTYNLFDPCDLFDTIMRMKTYNDNICKKIITDSQDYILKNETSKYKTSPEIFQKVIKKEE